MYAIELTPRAQKKLRKLDRDIRARLMKAIAALAENPFPPDAKKLTGAGKLWRIRVGDYRVVYQVDGNRLIIVIVDVGHRREIYR